MLAKMKTGTRVLLGFGFAVAITVIVGAVGYWGISGLSEHVTEIGVVRLPSVRGLNLIAKGQLTVGYGRPRLDQPPHDGTPDASQSIQAG